MESTAAYSIAEISKPNTPFSRSTIYQEIKAGRLKARKLGRKTIILADDYRTWLETLAPYAAQPLDHAGDQMEAAERVQDMYGRGAESDRAAKPIPRTHRDTGLAK